MLVVCHRLEAQDEDPASRPLVTEVVFNGVKSVDINQLRLGLATRGVTCRSPLYLPICWLSRSPLFSSRQHLDPLELRRDVLRIRLFYWQRGWRDAVVTARTERSGPGVRAIFDIDEHEPTVMTSLTVVQTDSVLPRSAIDRSLRLKAGDPLDLLAMDSTVLSIRDELWEQGRAAAEVTLDTSQVDGEANRGPVTITIRGGPRITIEDIELEGNERVSDETILRLLSFKPGDLFRRSAILDSQRSLYLSGMFSELDIEAYAFSDSLRIVQLRVVEADHNRLEVSGGLTTADFVQLESQFTRFNFLGSARRLTARGTLSNLLASSLNGQGIFLDVTDAESGGGNRFLQPTWSASVEVLQPWLFSPRNQLGVTVFGHRSIVPGIVIDRGVGATAAFTRAFGPRTNATLGYTWELSRVDASDVYFCVSFGVCLNQVIDALSSRHVLAPVASVTQFDVTDDPFAPTRGYRARVDLEHASRFTASDFAHNRIEVTASNYVSLARRSVLASRVHLGWVQGLGESSALGAPAADDGQVIHPRKRFYAGGSLSVRGFGERQLGPRVLTISPDALTDTSLSSPCSSGDIRSGACDPNIAGLDAAAFQPQPIGGSAIAEASIEYRFPLSTAMGVTGAVFLDGALIGTSQLTNLLSATGSITPGFGIRLDTPVGPVRLDLGVRPTLVEDLPVITQVNNTDGTAELVTLDTRRRYDPLDTKGGFLRQVLSRLRLHLAIGPPF
jgi:outer membrane protein insertion porin family/translocation and assembly module TamA